MRTLVLILIVAALSASAVAQATEKEEPNPQATIRRDVRLVNVFASVISSAGKPVTGLTKEDFVVLEDGNAENVAVFDRHSELPLSIVVAVDTSLSTKKDLPLELESARRFIKAILRPIDGASLYQFSEVVDELTPFTADIQQIDRALKKVRVGAATALYDAVYLAAEALEQRQGRKILVVITDGGDTYSKVSYAEAVRAATDSEAAIYPIIMVPVAASAGRDTGGEHALIQISRDTGGRYYYATSQEALDRAFIQIGEELRTQYLLGYYPSRRLADSSFRKIEVKLKGDPENVFVRHRYGYYTSARK